MRGLRATGDPQNRYFDLLLKVASKALLAPNPDMPRIAFLAPLDFDDKPCQRAVSAQIDVSRPTEPANMISHPGDTHRCYFERLRNRDIGSPAQVP